MSDTSKPRQRRSIGGFFADVWLNFTFEQLAFFMMRVSGLALVAYIGLHIWTLSGILHGTAAFDKHLELYNIALGGRAGGRPTIWFAGIEWLLLVCVIFHAANGLRIIVADFHELTRSQRRMLWYVGVATVLIGGLSLVWFIPGLGF